MNKETFITDTITLANTVELVKHVINKVGFVYIAPLDPAIQDEKISKAVTAAVKKGKAE